MTLVIQISNEKTGTAYLDVAECGGVIVKKSKGGSIHTLARKLQDEGVDREALVTVKRGETTVFAERPLHKWADFALYEPDKGPFRLVRWNYEASEKFSKQRKEEVPA